MDQQYSKLLVAKYNPKNMCCAPDGTVLLVLPRVEVPLKAHVFHYFTSTEDWKTKSKYGWVKEVPQFTLAEFIKMYCSEHEVTDNLKSHLKIMLSSASSLAADTPVAATYSCRGFEKKHMDFTVHKVFFYKT